MPFGTITHVSESPKRFGLLYVGHRRGQGLGHARRRRGLDGRLRRPRPRAVGDARGGVHASTKARSTSPRTGTATTSSPRTSSARPTTARPGSRWRRACPRSRSTPSARIRRCKTLLYLGTDMGVFASLDSGKTWTAMAGGLPHVPVHDLQVHPREGDLVLATHGRSVYLTEAAPLRKLSADVMGKAVFAFPIKTVAGDPSRGYGEHPWITWPRADGGGADPLLGAHGRKRLLRDQGRKREHLEGDLGPRPGGDERARIRPRRRCPPRRRGGSRGEGQGAREGSARGAARRRRRPGRRRGKPATPSPSPTPPADDEEEEDGTRASREPPPPPPASRCSIRSWSACSPTRCARRASATCRRANTRSRCARAAPRRRRRCGSSRRRTARGTAKTRSRAAID